VCVCIYIYIYIYHHHHHHISVIVLGHLLTRSGLTYPEVSSKVCHDSFCQLGNSVLLPSVIYYRAFCLHAGGNAIPKHASPEAESSNPTTGLTLLWACNPLKGNFNHWQVSRKEAGQIFFKIYIYIYIYTHIFLVLKAILCLYLFCYFGSTESELKDYAVFQMFIKTTLITIVMYISTWSLFPT
jgi:hypothetical protein